MVGDCRIICEECDRLSLELYVLCFLSVEGCHLCQPSTCFSSFRPRGVYTGQSECWRPLGNHERRPTDHRDSVFRRRGNHPSGRTRPTSETVHQKHRHQPRPNSMEFTTQCWCYSSRDTKKNKDIKNCRRPPTSCHSTYIQLITISSPW